MLLPQIKHNKNYNETVDGGKQEKIRNQVFLDKDAKIKKHNSGNSTYKLAHNKFSDMVCTESALFAHSFYFLSLTSVSDWFLIEFLL